MPILEHLCYGPKRAKEWLAELKQASIANYEVGQELYVDIRTYGTGWYDEELIFLEDRYDKIYVVIYQVTAVAEITDL